MAQAPEQEKSDRTNIEGKEAQQLGHSEIEEQIEHEIEPKNVNYMAEPMYVGWLNIQNINRSGIRQQLVRQAENQALTYLALTETHQTEAGMERHDDFYLYFAPGKPHTGTALLLHKSLQKKLKDIEHISDRIMLAIFNGQAFQLNFLIVYAPTSEISSQEKETFLRKPYGSI